MIIGDGMVMRRKLFKGMVMGCLFGGNLNASKNFLENKLVLVGDMDGMTLANDLESNRQVMMLDGGLVKHGEWKLGIGTEDSQNEVGGVLVSD